MANLSVNDTRSINCSLMGPAKNKIFTPIGSLYVTNFVAMAVPVVCILGLIGNVSSFIIMKDSGKKLSSHFFIKVLTIFDCLSLIFFLPAGWLNLFIRPFYHHLRPGEFTWADDVGGLPFMCEARLYLTFATRTISIWTIVSFTVERGVMVVWPYFGQRVCTMKNAKICVALVVIFSLLINVFCLFAFEQRIVPCSGGRMVCAPNNLFFHYRSMEFVILSVIPSAVILVANLAIIVTLRRRRAAAYIASEEQAVLKERDREITQRLLLVSSAFFVLNMPLMVVTSAHNYMHLVRNFAYRRGLWADSLYITLFLFYTNLAINFILYCFTGKTFRRAAFALFTCNLPEMRRHRRMLDTPKESTSNPTDRTDASRRTSDLSSQKVNAVPAVTNPDAKPLAPQNARQEV